MNNGRMWLVVKPTVGIPIFLGAVAVGSFAVHVAVLTNTGWVSDFLSGRELGTTQSAQMAQEGAAKVVFKEAESGENLREAVVTLPDGRTAKAVFDPVTRVRTADKSSDSTLQGL